MLLSRGGPARRRGPARQSAARAPQQPARPSLLRLMELKRRRLPTQQRTRTTARGHMGHTRCASRAALWSLTRRAVTSGDSVVAMQRGALQACVASLARAGVQRGCCSACTSAQGGRGGLRELARQGAAAVPDGAGRRPGRHRGEGRPGRQSRLPVPPTCGPGTPHARTLFRLQAVLLGRLTCCPRASPLR